jgi:hypothetical protein
VAFLFWCKDGRLRPFSASAGTRPGIYAGLAESGAAFLPLVWDVNPVHGVPVEDYGLDLRNALKPVEDLSIRVVAALILNVLPQSSQSRPSQG